MRSAAILCVLMLVVLVAGCQQEQTTPTTLSAPEASVVETGPPVTSGPFVLRGETVFAIFQVDYKKGLMVIFSTNIQDYCSGNFWFDLVNFMDIDTQDDAARVVEILNGDVTTSVWATTTFDCSFFLNNSPLAMGTAHLESTDNDLFAYLHPETPNVNSYGWMAQGALYDAMGNRYHFNSVDRITWDGVDLGTTREMSKINLVGVSTGP